MNRLRMAKPWNIVGNNGPVYISFLLFTLIVLLPVYWMVRSSVAAGPDLIKLPLIYFPTPTQQNFKTLIDQVPFFQYIRNSLTFALATTLVTLVVSYLAAYAFARIQFRTRCRHEPR